MSCWLPQILVGSRGPCLSSPCVPRHGGQCSLTQLPSLDGLNEGLLSRLQWAPSCACRSKSNNSSHLKNHESHICGAVAGQLRRPSPDHLATLFAATFPIIQRLKRSVVHLQRPLLFETQRPSNLCFHLKRANQSRSLISTPRTRHLPFRPLKAVCLRRP